MRMSHNQMEEEGQVNPREDNSQEPGTASHAPAKFIQVCASQNDLFALDEEGSIYQYNFSAKTWGKLGASRSHEGPERGDHGKRSGARVGFH